jgi:hypothetical protein
MPERISCLGSPVPLALMTRLKQIFFNDKGKADGD